MYFLAEQMGTSAHMIEERYGHVNTIKHADRNVAGHGRMEAAAPGSGRYQGQSVEGGGNAR